MLRQPRRKREPLNAVEPAETDHETPEDLNCRLTPGGSSVDDLGTDPGDCPFDDDDQSSYERHRDNMGRRMREKATEGRDIGPIPAVKNPKRRESCKNDLKRFLLTYFPEAFPLEFSEDHLRILKSIENKAINVGLQAIAMSRGSGKTTILIRCAMWALMYGHRSFLMLIEADGQAAEESLDGIKIELETNNLLLEDFPEICYPIRQLDGITQRANAQTSNGDRTLMSWKRREIIFPTIPGSVASGATLRCSGILGRIRGAQKILADGKVLRPNFVLVNDPQTDLSARSQIECAKREKVMSGAILGLGGPGKTIAGFAALTVILEGDMADRLLNDKISPKWHGERCKMVYQWPTNEALWEQYLKIRADEIAEGNDEHPRATRFYKQNRKAMDEGAKVGWPARFLSFELSAIQHAYNLRQDNPDTFDAEYNNTPKPSVIAPADLRVLSSDEYCLRVLPTHKRMEIPLWAEHLNVGIDVQESTLWWVLLASSEDFRSVIVDYGIWPDQGVDYVTLDKCDRTIARATQIGRPADALIEALRRLTSELSKRAYVRDDQSMMSIEKFIVDSGYRSDAIYRFASETTLPVLPSKGIGVTARKRPWDAETKKPGERVGLGWRMPPVRKLRTPRHVIVDSNRWKTFLCDCFSSPIDEAGSWALFKASPARHRMLADNLSAEFPTKTAGHGRELYEWTPRVGRDNHFLDATILAGVGASISGANVKGESTQRVRRARRRVEIPAEKRSRPGHSASYETPASSNGRSSGRDARPRRSLAQMRAEKR